MFSSKNKKFIFIAIWVLSIIICAFFSLFNPIVNTLEGKQTQVEQTDRYIIGVYDEKVAVFTQGDAVPIEIYDVYISTLPERDQKTLEKGIEVKGKIELRRLIEDYTS